MGERRQIILNEGLWSLLVRLSVPGILGMLLVSCNAFVDALYVGRFVSAEALVAVSMCIPLMVLNTAFINLIAAGANSILSRSIGRQDKVVQQQLFAHVLAFSAASASLIMLISIVWGEHLVAWTGVKGKVLHEGVQYFKVAQAGCFFSIFGLASSGLIRAEGQIKRAMLISAVSVLCNALLNPLFIIVCGMGISGSALATIVSMCIYCFLTTLYFRSGQSLVSIKIHRHIWQWSICKEMILIGSSAMIMQLSSFIRQLFLFKAINHFGSAAQVILFSAIYRLYSFSMIPVFGIIQSMQPVIGINYGAKQYRRMNKALGIFLFGCIALVFVIAFPSILYPAYMLRLLIPDVVIDAMAIYHLRLMLLILFIAPISSVCIVYLQATGHAKWSMKLVGGRDIILFLPLLFLSVHLCGYQGAYYAILLENFLYASIMLLVLRYYMKYVPLFDLAIERPAFPFGLLHFFNRKISK